MLFESTRHHESDVYAKGKPPVYLYTSGFFMGAGGFEQLAFTHTYTGELKNHRRQATFHSTQDSLKQQCAQFCA
jgi:hypothetical protein